MISLRTALMVVCFLSWEATAHPGHTHIIGGNPSHPGEFPHIIQIQTQVGGVNVTHCGASLAEVEGRQFVITSAGCTTDLGDTEVRMIAGDYDQSVESGREQLRMSTRIIRHPDHDADKHVNDIAIIGISEPFNLAFDVQPVTLPMQGEATVGGFLLVAGWGGDQETEQGRGAVTKLQKIQLPMITDLECQLRYATSTSFHPVASHLCGMSRSGTNAHCLGDRGGPVESTDRKNVLAGIISYPTSCTDAEPGRPDVYTEVSHFVDWIQQTAREL